MDARILVVDDEPEIADLVEVYLQSEGCTVYKCNSGSEALGVVKSKPVDLAILDVMLPDISGFTLCGEIRREHHFPVLMLTAKTGDMDKITGLTIGADDYITKPFNPLELMARVKAQLRRYTRYSGKEAAKEQVLTFSGLTVDVKTRECTLNGKPLSLTPTEFSILRILCENQGRVVSSEELFHQVWGDEYYSKNNNTITVHIRHLREKLGDSFEHPRYIKTIWGVGYGMEP